MNQEEYIQYFPPGFYDFGQKITFEKGETIRSVNNINNLYAMTYREWIQSIRTDHNEYDRLEYDYDDDFDDPDDDTCNTYYQEFTIDCIFCGERMLIKQKDTYEDRKKEKYYHCYQRKHKPVELDTLPVCPSCEKGFKEASNPIKLDPESELEYCCMRKDRRDFGWISKDHTIRLIHPEDGAGLLRLIKAKYQLLRDMKKTHPGQKGEAFFELDHLADFFALYDVSISDGIFALYDDLGNRCWYGMLAFCYNAVDEEGDDNEL